MQYRYVGRGTVPRDRCVILCYNLCNDRFGFVGLSDLHVYEGSERMFGTLVRENG